MRERVRKGMRKKEGKGRDRIHMGMGSDEVRETGDGQVRRIGSRLGRKKHIRIRRNV